MGDSVQTAAPAAPKIDTPAPGNPRIPIREHMWSVDFYACYKDIVKGGTDDSDMICISATFCPCVMEGKIAAVVNNSFAHPPAKPMKKEGIQFENCLVHLFTGSCCQVGSFFCGPMGPMACMCSCAGIPASFMRKAVRDRYGIPGNKPSDILSHYFCFPCALVQEYNELALRIPKTPGFEWTVLEFLKDDTEVDDF